MRDNSDLSRHAVKKEVERMAKAHELTENEYLATMSGGMKNVTDTAGGIVDIWEYASNFGVRMLLSDYGFENRIIEAVYENSSCTYQHILLFGLRENVYIVVVVDMQKGEVYGHYYLDLNEKYGLDESSSEL